ncbi:hypothetical protein ACIQF6_00795 [Kitasatospora sp. NPDC092948]
MALFAARRPIILHEVPPGRRLGFEVRPNGTVQVGLRGRPTINSR